MKIFVGYHYDRKDQWVKELVFPLIEAFGDEVVTGEKLYGEHDLGKAVTKKIKRCDALLGFLTRRNRNTDSTHRWVIEEINTARNAKLKFVEIREDSVDPQRGSAEGSQFIAYNEKKRDRCLVQLAEALGSWHRQRRITLQFLLPEKAARTIAALIKRNQYRCYYQLYEAEGDALGPVKSINLRVETGGVFASVRDVPPEAAIQLRIESGAKKWSSDFTNTSHSLIRLTENKRP